MTFEQENAVGCFDRPVAVVAAAGSGKTTVLVERYLRCLSRGLQPDQILCVTFTNEAASQLKERILARLGTLVAETDPVRERVAASSNISTLHGFCLNFLQTYGEALGYPRVERILDAFDTAEIFASQYPKWLRECDRPTLAAILGEKRPTELETLARAAFEKRTRYLRDWQGQQGDPSPAEPVVNALGLWMQAIQSDLHARGLFSFDDLESVTIELLEKSPESADSARAQYRAILVDEFQDTSPEQWSILQHLGGDDLAKIFVVGDPKQSIYSFRGADIHVYLEAAGKLAGSQAAFELSTTYRAHPELVSWVNRFANRIFQGTEVPFLEMRPGRLDSEFDDFGDRVRIRRSQTSDEELVNVVADVRAAIDRGVKLSEIALLFRFSDRIPPLVEALRAVGIAVRCSRSESLFEQYAVRDVCAYLRAFAKPADDAALAAFLKTPYAGFTDSDLDSLRQDRSRGWYASWSFHPTLRHRAKWFRELAESGELSVWPVLQRLFAESGYLPANADALVHFVDHLTLRAQSIPDALEKIEAWEKEFILHASRLEDSDEAVSLLTVHGAKGLEFDHVILSDCARRPPHLSPPLLFATDRTIAIKSEDEHSAYSAALAKGKNAQSDESKRLLYVALTRAKESLSVYLPATTAKVPGESWAALFERFEQAQESF